MDIIKTTEKLSEILTAKNLSRISVKVKDAEIVLERQQQALHVLPPAPVVAESASVPAVAEATPTVAAKSGNFVTSPIVGTFYAAPAPEKPPFVQVGDKVTKGQVVCIVESMKLMNEITSEFDGTVAAILAMDGDAVDFNKELIEIV